MQRRHALIALLVLVALALGYFGGRANAPALERSANIPHSEGDAAISTKGKSGTATLARKSASARADTHAGARAPLPAPGAPLKQTMAELQARADAGDAEAASRLYRDERRCAEVRRINASVPRYVRYLLDEKTEGLSPVALQGREQQLADMEKRLNFARDSASLCADLSDDEINQYFPAALQAAQLGDAAAADCYVGGGATFGMPPGLLDHPERLLDYKQNALALANDAITRGDWTMVSLLGDAYNNGGVSISIVEQLTGRDSVQAYRYLKLRRLGALSGAKGVDVIDKELAQMANEIPADAKLAGDAWAQDAYQRYFGTNPQNTALNNYSVCQEGL